MCTWYTQFCFIDEIFCFHECDKSIEKMLPNISTFPHFLHFTLFSSNRFWIIGLILHSSCKERYIKWFYKEFTFKSNKNVNVLFLYIWMRSNHGSVSVNIHILICQYSMIIIFWIEIDLCCSITKLHINADQSNHIAWCFGWYDFVSINASWSKFQSNMFDKTFIFFILVPFTLIPILYHILQCIEEKMKNFEQTWTVLTEWHRS